MSGASRPNVTSADDPEFARFRLHLWDERTAWRQAAMGELLRWANEEPPQPGSREMRKVAKFITDLHAHAWRDEKRVLPPNRIVPGPTVSDAEIRRWHRELRRACDILFPIPPAPRWERRQWQPPIRAQRLALLQYHRRFAQITVATWPDTVWVTVLSLLEEFGPRVHRCPVCQTLFLKHKRQMYCSATCAQRARSSRWYARHGDLARKRRRDAYSRAMLKGRRGFIGKRR
jgi:hypothetical protein